MTESQSPQPAPVHTPWHVDSLVECPNVHIIGTDGRTLAVAFQRDDHPRLGQGITVKEAREHACLMAAAPELLEALIECRERLALYVDHTEDLIADMKAAKAIAKATGAQA